MDAERIGLFGICGGGGYTIKAAQTEKRAKAVATLSMFNTGIVRLYGLGNSQADTIQARLAAAIEARDKEARGEGVQYPPAREPMTREQVDALPPGLYRDGIYYYGMDYAHPNSGGQPPVKCLIDLVDFDARHNMELITQPLLMMAGSEADTLYMTKDCFALVPARRKRNCSSLKARGISRPISNSPTWSRKAKSYWPSSESIWLAELCEKTDTAFNAHHSNRRETYG